VLARFPVLAERIDQLAGTLSGGEQQMLVIGRALMSRPRLMLLDEPSLGLAPLIGQRVFDIVRELNTQGVAILLVEQNARAALKLAKRGYVIETGRVVLEGSDLAESQRIREAFLGVDVGGL
jgi:branched-chain amino acid transport system ATP-binding protein